MTSSFSVLRKFREIANHWIVNPHLASIDQLHHCNRGRDHLGERCDIENRIYGHRLAARLDGPAPKRFAVDDLTVVANNEQLHQGLPGVDGVFDNRVENSERVRT